MMLYHNILNSDDDRLVKRTVEYQEMSGHEKCWFGNLKKEGEELGIEVNEGKVKGVMKSNWKREVKKKIQMAVEKKISEKKTDSKKLRFIKEGSNKYLDEVFNEDATMAIKIRLNMVSWIDGNEGGDNDCPLCEEAEYTTEHVFECPSSTSEMSVNDLVEGKSMKEVVELFKRNEEMRRTLLRTNIQDNMEMLSKERTL